MHFFTHMRGASPRFQQMQALALAAGLVARQALPSFAREPLTMWFWSAPPAYQEVLTKSLVDTFDAMQDKYHLTIEFKNGVDSDVRVSVMANQGPDLVYTSGPTNVTPLAKAGKLASMDAYAQKYGWNDKLFQPALASCTSQGHLYCLPPSIQSDGMFYNKKVLADNGWTVPKAGAELEAIMQAAQKKGMYASATGNKGWQPINQIYSTIFVNQYVGPADLYQMLSGKMSMNSPGMLKAMQEMNRWFKAGYLGGKDYFSLDFDTSLKYLSEGKTPFFFSPNFAFQWANKYFKDDTANDIGWTAFPQLDSSLPYPIYSIGSAFTYSINAASSQDKQDAAAAVINIMMSPDFVVNMSRVWPGYWAAPLKDFPSDPQATGVVASFYAAAKEVANAVGQGDYGYKMAAFFPPQTTDVFTKDVENMWLDKETPQDVVTKAADTFDKEFGRGVTQAVPKTAPAK
jgi:raffinose/stachyose/melibiose transport system substrate-binding protein